MQAVLLKTKTYLVVSDQTSPFQIWYTVLADMPYSRASAPAVCRVLSRNPPLKMFVAFSAVNFLEFFLGHDIPSVVHLARNVLALQPICSAACR